ncbi:MULTISPECIES: GDSL-type esterase/lipase family protein [unclassified Streptomyces]|uniref:GDSL-type esterase/lipase family protein n=1 Tax=unclassified Streptomyces TaxID=2593676 RepID=UPI0023661D1A|nr:MULTISPECIES: GDSL-type esterase/lipase family protein [unclassified Streptomyces]MDF3140808.1 GDSL-type esterase/lipase family protein [Streptomyces sp. T21Q-yed]WDF42983.1 GDSL-type esterase/lipase family protein [Streptomyces sp. T12]
MSGVDRRTSLAAAVAVGLLLGAQQPALASGDPNVVRPDDRRLAYEGHWGRTAEAATTVNSGSRLRFRFTGSSIHALFDVASITVPAQVYVSVDGRPKRLRAVDRSDLEITAEGRGPHSVEISVKDVFSRANRWTPPLETGVVLTGLRLGDGGHLLHQPARSARKLVFYGDSITQGVMALCEVNTSDCADGTAAYPTLVADALRASLTQVGFGRQGVIQTGNGGVPAAADAYGWNHVGSRADSDRRADVIVVNQGTNDATYGSDAFRAAYRAYLDQLRAAAPHARILALRPFNGAHADDIAAVVGELADPRTEFVDTTDWLSPADGDFNGTVHPSAQGHRRVADRLIALLAKEL